MKAEKLPQSNFNIKVCLAASAYRIPEDQASLIRIPVTPIGYGDAVKYLEKMNGTEVKESWKGGLDITYRYGPGFLGNYSDRFVYLEKMTFISRKCVLREAGVLSLCLLFSYTENAESSKYC